MKRTLVLAALTVLASVESVAAQGLFDRVIGGGLGDQFGASSAGLGDVTGDGIEDFAVGAPLSDQPAANCGSVRITSGVDGTTFLDLRGSALGDQFGRTVAGLGDIDGDGFGDLAIGAPQADVNGLDSGTISIVSGHTGALIRAMHGRAAKIRLGDALANAGDVDGDGIDDLIAGTPFDDQAGANAGSARVFSGANGSQILLLFGNSAQDQFGSAVSGVGDINGDGRADVAVGAPLDDPSSLVNAGSVVVFSGASGTPLFHTDGVAPGDRMGSSVASFPGEVIAGAPGSDAAGTDSGSVRVFGTSGGLLLQLVGEAPGDAFGTCVAGISTSWIPGAIATIVVGAPGHDSTGSNAGRWYVYESGGALRYYDDGPTAGVAFGASLGVARSSGNPQVVVGATGAGSPSGAAATYGYLTPDFTQATPTSSGCPYGGTAVVFDIVGFDAGYIANVQSNFGLDGGVVTGSYRHGQIAFVTTEYCHTPWNPCEQISLVQHESTVKEKSWACDCGCPFLPNWPYPAIAPNGGSPAGGDVITITVDCYDPVRNYRLFFGEDLQMQLPLTKYGDHMTFVTAPRGDQAEYVYVALEEDCWYQDHEIIFAYHATPPTTYCTAKINSLGCTPTISYTGTPDCCSGSGFNVIATRVRNNKPGLLFYSLTGSSSLLFQGGTLCVANPIRRTPAVAAGGSPFPAQDCSGIFSIDMNAFAAGSLGGAPAPALQQLGTTVWCQWWGRDPGFPAPNSTTLSDALKYRIEHSGGGGGSAGSMAGTIAVPTLGGAVIEAEPNDNAVQAHILGDLAPGGSITVIGACDVATDPIDAFLMHTTERVRINATVSFDPAGGNDIDYLVFDPLHLGAPVALGVSQAEPEVGSFHAKGAFYFAINAFNTTGVTSYTLRLDATAATDPILEEEPNGNPGQQQYLGEMLVGDALNLAGSVNFAGIDDSDRILIACPENTTLAFSLAMPAAANFDLYLSDATGNLGSPVPITQFTSPTNNPETGSIAIPAMTLVDVQVRAAAGAGAYTLTITGGVDSAVVAGRPARIHTPTESFAALRPERSLRFADADLRAVTGEMLVLAKPGEDLAPSLARRGCRILDRIPGGAVRVEFDQPQFASDAARAEQTLAMARSFGAARGVAYAELNLMRRAMNEPNDALYNLQWHYPLIQLPAAWDLETGSNNVITAVIDTGQTLHPDLDSRLIAGFDFISNPTSAGDGNGIDADPSDVGDGNGVNPSSFHGTHVAGTIGAETNNNQGVAGVTWAGRIMHLRVLGIGGGTDFDIANAVLYAAKLPNNSTTVPLERASIINMSLGGSGFNQTMQNAVTAAHNAGVVVFAAAGNNNSGTPSYPAAYDDVISVSAVDLNAAKAPYSNFHATVDIAAPGGDTSKDLNGDGYGDGVLSTLVDDSVQPSQFIYGFYQGTSMACPHAAGVAALVLSSAPGLTPDQVEQILESTATDLGAPGHDPIFGNGLINAYRAVLTAQQGVPVTPVLGLSTQTLAFDTTATVLNVQVSNLGGGVLHVAPPAVSTVSGGNWLTATRVTVTNPVTTDTSAIAVAVSRVGLADGIYQGTVDVTSNGGALSIQVAMQVSAVPPVENIDIFVLAVDATTLHTIAEDVINPTTGVAYALLNLPAGTYYLVAGSDVNNNNIICEPGEKYCGLYPTLNQPELVNLGPNQAILGLDFAVASPIFGASVPFAPSGYRRLPYVPLRR